MIRYYADYLLRSDSTVLQALVQGLPWEKREDAPRKECFMSDPAPISYTYGQGRGVRTYTSVEMYPWVKKVMAQLNRSLSHLGWGPMNGCFLNLYEDHRHALGWHADDFHRMDHTQPVCVISLGEPREIWWRENGTKGVTPPTCRMLLEPGSLFIMEPGFQHTHQHRIPKGSREMGPRVSLTFRAFLP